MGLFVRYALVPVILLPIAWPWLLLLSAYTAAQVVSNLAGKSIDAVVLTAELLKQNRRHIENLATWLCAQLGYCSVRYAGLLSAAHYHIEQVIVGIGDAIQPLIQEMLYRSPALARILGPAIYVGSQASQTFDRFYNFIHDEIVPVALDLAERLPLVHSLLLKHAIQPD